MIPVVLLEGKTIAPDEIRSVGTFHEIGMRDVAEITVEKPQGEVPYITGQAVEVNLSASGGLIFSGSIVGVEPTYAENVIVIRCLTKALGSTSIANEDPHFADSDYKIAFNDKTASVKIPNSRETVRVLYDLGWTKKVRLDPSGNSSYVGVRFVGKITRVDRHFTRSQGPEVALVLVKGAYWNDRLISGQSAPLRH